MKELLSELSQVGKRGYQLPSSDVPIFPLLPTVVRKSETLTLPSVGELEVVRHFTHLASITYNVDKGMYPLGSCTMKYNPKVNEEIASNPLFTDIHPLQDSSTVQGSLSILHSLNKRLCSIVGMDDGTLQSAAGAQGEYIGLHIIKSYHMSRGDHKRNTVLIPTNAHGTNPASAAFCNMDVKEVPVNNKGLVDVEALTHLVDDTTAAIMLTNPNTLGLYEDDITKIASIIHSSGGLLYYDGANLNAIMNIVKPGAMGFDVLHVNVHKTFSTPHGGGGPGAGPVLVKEFLSPFLPSPHIKKDTSGYSLSFDTPQSIGKTLGFFGNFLVLLRAYSYITHLGDEGLRYAAKISVLHANYMKARLKEYIPLSHEGNYLHEIVLSLKELKEKKQMNALAVAKALIDKGLHPPTIYFPLIVPEAMMIEPTETESLRDIDAYVDALIEIVTSPSTHSSPILPQIDEVVAARKLILHW